MTATNRVAKNTTYLTAAYVGQKVLTFCYFLLIARFIGVSDIGKYVFALSFTTIWSVLIDLGCSPLLTREGAKDKNKLPQLLSTVISVKVVLAIVVYAIAAIAVNLLGKEPLVRELVYIAGAIMVLDSFSLTFYAAFRARQELQYESLGMILGQICIFIVGVSAVLLHWPLHALIAAILVGSTFNAVYSFWLLKRHAGLKLTLHWHWSIIKPMLIAALPFAVAGVFARLYGYLDAVLLSTLGGDSQLGWYSAGYKITFALQFIPQAFAAALFPAMAAAYASDRSLLAKTFEKSMFVLLIVSVPISAGVAVLAPQIIGLMYGAAFAPTAVALRILILSLPFVFLSFPVGALLNAADRQTTNTINLGVVMAINAALNLILIPLLGPKAYIGSSIAVLVSSVLQLVLGIVWVHGIMQYNRRWLVKKVISVLVAAAAMVGVIWLLVPLLHVLLLIPLGAIVYMVVLWLVRGIHQSELYELKMALQRTPPAPVEETEL